MIFNIDKTENEKSDTFLEILKNDDDTINNSDKKILFVTTDCWIAQLGSRKE